MVLKSQPQIIKTDLSNFIGNPIEYYIPPKKTEILKEITNFSNVTTFLPQSKALLPKKICEPEILISELNEGMLNFQIKVRVSYKSELNSVKKILRIILIDKELSEIELSIFGETILKYADFITKGKIYSISGGKIKKLISKKFTIANNFLIINCDSSTKITEIPDDNSIPQIRFFPTPYENLLNQIDTNLDICGIVKSICEIHTPKIKEPYKELILIDEHLEEIKIVFFSNQLKKM